MGPRGERGEHGFSLVESVVAIAVLGLIVAAMVGGMATSIATADIHRQQSEVNTVMLSAAEIVKSVAYISCAGQPGQRAYSASAAIPADPAWQQATGALAISVQFWNSTASPAGFDKTGACHDADGTGGLFPMQQVTITITHPHSRATAAIDIIKRGP